MTAPSSKPPAGAATPVSDRERSGIAIPPPHDSHDELHRLSRHERAEIAAGLDEIDRDDIATGDEVALMKRKHGLA